MTGFTFMWSLPGRDETRKKKGLASGLARGRAGRAVDFPRPAIEDFTGTGVDGLRSPAVPMSKPSPLGTPSETRHLVISSN